MGKFRLQEQFQSLIHRINASDTIFIAIGISAFIVGILVDVFVLRLVCLLIVLASAGLMYASLRAKHLQIQTGTGGHNSLFHSHSESDRMKKLIFDDFQMNSTGRFSVEEVDEEYVKHGPEHAAREEQAASPDPMIPKTVQPYVPLQQEVRQPVREFQTSDFFDVDSEIYKGDSEPRTEFDFLLNKVLTVIKDVLFANTVAFFWANREKQQMVLEARVTDCSNFMSTRRFAMGHDLVSKVAQTGRPEFITAINPVSEPELFPYYESPALVKSFIGVPVFFARGIADPSAGLPVAVIVVDSKAEDEFGQETMELLGKFTKLVSALIKSYNDKYDLLLDSELLTSIRRLQERIRNSFSLPTIVQALAEEASKLINWDYLSIVLYEESKRAWVVKRVTNRAHSGYVITEQAIDFPESIVGQTIRSNTHTVLDDLSSARKPRFFATENLSTQGSFLSIPVSSLNKCYGAVNLESKEKFNFSRKDTDMLYRLAENAASALEVYYLQDVIHEYVIIDDVTGAYSKKFFLQRIGEELQRSDDAGTDLSLLFVTVDKSAEISERFGDEGFERVILALAKAIRSSIRPYDILGRYDGNKFGVLLINTAANDAYLWAEKIRKNIAALVINLDGKSFSMTISVGVCGALEGMRREELLGNATTVLNRAAEAGGNLVRVF